ncbi:MAG TPA: tRNA (adenosine(37)-N6)-threonylcarbamoyltransferase complex ATPase subunit type 1 TsaE [Candidatus Binataceae bacterium]|nr:tRNA (adenosine(37)-N6)-threonylcarbamoyltransferase complex ATPase subunit type 1 TsaE [Candidatus Binataceae bacterium]
MSVEQQEKHQIVTLVVESASAHETKTWGRRLASLLTGGELLGLIGELGVGKTCFIKGLARGLGLREEEILSPTFTMIQEHRGRLPLYHIDLYRLETAMLDDMGLREYLFSEGIAAVEWFDRLREMPELEFLEVRISYIGAHGRSIEFRGRGERLAGVVARLKSGFA